MTVKITITSYNKDTKEKHFNFQYLRNGEILKIFLQEISSKKIELACIIENENNEVYLTDKTSQGIIIQNQFLSHCIIHDGDTCILPYDIIVEFSIYVLSGKDLFHEMYFLENSITLEYIESKSNSTTELKSPLGKEINGYYFEDILSYGQVCIVYKGIQESLKRKVVIKTISSNTIDNQVLATKFINILNFVRKLNHPYIVQFYDSGMNEEYQIYYFVMEYIEGSTLRSLLDENFYLNLEMAYKIMRQLVVALAYSHHQKIIHRNINPSNIIVTKNDYIKLIGLGLSKMLDIKQLANDAENNYTSTIGYLSPEQALNRENIDYRTDIYSVGVVFYECVCGCSPYDSDSLQNIELYKKALQNKITKSPYDINNTIPIMLSNIIMKCLEPNPEDRYQTMEDLLKDLIAYEDAIKYSTARERMTAMFSPNPTSSIFDFYVLFEPVEELGGDFYDYIPLEEEKWGISIGDVTGHGVEAAVIMGMVKAVIKVLAKNFDSAAMVLEATNKEVSTEIYNTTFTTVNYSILDGKKKTLRLARAGHHPLILFNPKRDPEIITYTPKGTVLGVPWSLNLEEIEISLQEGDILVQFTDGIIESTSSSNEEFGLERLCNVIKEQIDKTSEEIGKAIQNAVKTFVSDHGESDDMTLLVVKVKEQNENTK